MATADQRRSERGAVPTTRQLELDYDQADRDLLAALRASETYRYGQEAAELYAAALDACRRLK